MFSKIKARTIKLYNFLFSHKKQVAIFLFLVIFGLGIYSVFGSHSALADNADKGAGTPPVASDIQGYFMSAVTHMLLAGAGLMIKLAIWALSFIIEIAGYNGYLNSTAVQVGWVMVRDVTNMFFVVVLLLVAFGTILGLEQYEWKKMLVKFFFAAILVNFSRVICGVIIDVGQVIMITFVNGIAATAGGNLINAFNLTDILSLSKNSSGQAITDSSEIFSAAVGAITFAALTLGMMLVFVFILLSRMLVLWILIVLSPFAFVLSVIPQTEKYASQWWSEFGNHVIVGPVVVFFLWLSFAVVGSGGINSEISSSDNNSAPQPNMPGAAIGGKDGVSIPSAGITAAMSFDKIANFAIAIGILMVGAKTSQSLGTVGGSAMSKATDFAKKVATIGSGVAAGMWAYDKTKQGVKSGLGAVRSAAYNMTAIPDWIERTKNLAKTQVESWKIFRAEGPKVKEEEYVDEKTGELRKRPIFKKEKYIDQRTGEEKERDSEEYEFEGEDSRNWFQKWRYSSHAKLIKSRKVLQKTENQAKIRDELIDKRITAVPSGLFLRKMPDGFDRVEQGMLAAEKERSAAKTAEYQEYGRSLVLKNNRFKDGEFQKKGSVAEQIVGHKERAERNQARNKQILSGELEKFRKGEKGQGILAAKVEAQFKAEVSEKQAHLTEGAAKLEFLKGAQGIEQLAKRVKVEEHEKEEHEAVAEIEAGAKKTFYEDPHNRHLLEAVSESGQAKKAAETFVKNIESEVLSASFGKAKNDIDAIIEKWKADGSGDFSVLSQKMEEAGKNNHYIEALRQTEISKEKTKDSKYNESKAADFAANAVVNLAKGREIPSDATDALTEEEIKEYSGQERADASQKAADTMFYLMARAQTPGQPPLTESDRSAIMGSWGKVDSEAWNDDFADYFVRMVQQFKEKPDSLTGQKKVIAEQMAKLADSTGGIKGTMGADGKYKLEAGYTRRMSSMMQSLSATGGDTKLWQAHDAISQKQKSMSGDEWKKAGGYWGVAQQLAASNQLGGAGYSVGNMQESLKSHQDRLKYASKHFKKNGIDNGHWESVLNQEYDDSVGLYRMNTESDAQAGSVTEISKRTLAQQLNFQVHSAGELDLVRGLMAGINEKMFAALTSSLNEGYELKGMSSRSLSKLLGYHESEKIEEGQMGGDRMLQKFIGEFGDTEKARAEMEKHMVKDFLVQGMLGNAKGMTLMLQRAFNVSDKDASKGNFNFNFKHLAGGPVTNIKDLVTSLELDNIGLSSEDVKKLKDVAKNFEDEMVLSRKREPSTAQRES